MWFNYWRTMFPAVTEDRIAEFAAEYRGSSEEAADVLAAYTAAEGDLDEVLDNVMCATHEDEERFVGVIREALRAGRVKPFPAFTGERGGGGARRRGKVGRGCRRTGVSPHDGPSPRPPTGPPSPLNSAHTRRSTHA